MLTNPAWRNVAVLFLSVFNVLRSASYERQTVNDSSCLARRAFHQPVDPSLDKTYGAGIGRGRPTDDQRVKDTTTMRLAGALAGCT